MCFPYRLIELVKANVLLLAAQQSVIELSAADKAFIGMVLDGHALKA
jgi:hypothetical protein